MGDCNVPGYPDCHVDCPECSIGDGNWSAPRPWGNYNTTACGFDLGDCIVVPGYPDNDWCHVNDPKLIGDGNCDWFRDEGEYNPEACGWLGYRSWIS